VRCPICRQPLPRSLLSPREPERGRGAFPFCSDRCRQLDLGQWLGEVYRVPGEGGAMEPGGDEPVRGR